MAHDPGSQQFVVGNGNNASGSGTGTAAASGIQSGANSLSAPSTQAPLALANLAQWPWPSAVGQGFATTNQAALAGQYLGQFPWQPLPQGAYGPHRGHPQMAIPAQFAPYGISGPAPPGPGSCGRGQASSGPLMMSQGSNGHGSANASAPASSAPSAGHQAAGAQANAKPAGSAMVSHPALPAPNASKAVVAIVGGQAPQAPHAQAPAPSPAKSLFAQGTEAAARRKADKDVVMPSANEAALKKDLASAAGTCTNDEMIRQLRLALEHHTCIRAHREPAMKVDTPPHSPN